MPRPVLRGRKSGYAPVEMTILFEDGIARFHEGTSTQRSLHYATPDFLLNLVALAIFMRLSLKKAAHVAVPSVAWQEIRVRSGRDDNSA